MSTLLNRTLPIVAVLLVAAQAQAQTTVHRHSTRSLAAGEITDVSQTAVRVQPRVGPEVEVPANDVDYIEWEGVPAAYGQARIQDAAGQFAEAAATYQTAIDGTRSGNRNVRGDLQFLKIRADARHSLSTGVELEAVATRLSDFIDSNRNHFRYFEANLLLGRLMTAAGDRDRAGLAYARVVESPWPDYQMAARIGVGRMHLAQGDITAARREFTAVAEAEAGNPAARTQRFTARLGLAESHLAEAGIDEALSILQQVIDDATADETRVQAEAYLLQGRALAALGNRNAEAVLAFLHIDVIPALSREGDLHAEALYNLARLWPTINHPARASDTADRLQQLYPDSEWARRLGAG